MSMFYLQPDASQSIMGFPQRSAVYPRAPAASFSTSALRHRPTFPTPLSQEYSKKDEVKVAETRTRQGRFRAVLAKFRLGRRGKEGGTRVAVA